MKRRALLTLLLLTAPAVFAADSQPAPRAEHPEILPTSVDVRLGVLETRLAQAELAIAELRSVPATLARIEAQIEALSEKASGSAGVIGTLGLSLATALIGTGVGVAFGRQQKPST